MLILINMTLSAEKIGFGNDWFVLSSKDAGGINEISDKFESGYQVQLPATVMAALRQNGLYEDVFVGNNILNVDQKQFECGWWYVKKFNLEDFDSENYYTLDFDGINYSAEIYLNNKLIADRSNVNNAFKRYSFLINNLKQQNNILAVKVYPSVAGDFSTGFVDWNPEAPDKNMGIWRSVTLNKRGSAGIYNPAVFSKFTDDKLSEAVLMPVVQVRNFTDKEQIYNVKLKIGDFSVAKDVTVMPFSTLDVAFEPEFFPELILENPKIWWPNGYGTSPLYTADWEVSADNRVSDAVMHKFGIREIEDYLNEDGFRGYKINRRNLLIKGAGWVDDLFLSDSPQKVKDQIQYVKNMNLNCIRLEGFWGNDKTLYRECDKNGILVMAGWSCHWEWEKFVGKKVGQYLAIETDEEIALMTDSWADQVLWLRSHPSVSVWMMGSDKIPSPAYEQAMRRVLDVYDYGRPAQISAKEFNSKVSGESGMKMRGPYSYTLPVYWYEDKKAGGAFGFNSETGPGAQVPPLDSIKKMLNPNDLWPVSESWNFHCGRITFETLKRNRRALRKRYGRMESLEEFAYYSQLQNYEIIRPMFEAFICNRPKATGVVQWMLNSAWPEMFWQLYDWYMMPNGAFYGAMHGCKTQHLIYRYGKNDIVFSNETEQSLSDLNVRIRLLDINSTVLLDKILQIDSEADSLAAVLNLDKLASYKSPVVFLDMTATLNNGDLLDQNFYWLSAKKDRPIYGLTNWHYTPFVLSADYSELKNLPETVLEVRKTHVGEKTLIEITNTGVNIAFGLELMPRYRDSKEPVVPVFLSDNYLSVLPGETKIVELGDIDEEFFLEIKGCNIKDIILK
jgi:exo-1,4-beta-D-glucosaminidase